MTDSVVMLWQVRLSKLHLRHPTDAAKTVCGRGVNWQHMATPIQYPWLGPDKCLRCLAALERGSLGYLYEVGV